MLRLSLHLFGREVFHIEAEREAVEQDVDLAGTVIVSEDNPELVDSIVDYLNAASGSGYSQ